MNWLGLGTALAGFVKEFWKPIATLFGGLAAYWKGKSDARRAGELQELNRKLAANEARGRNADRVERTPEQLRRDELAKWEQ